MKDPWRWAACTLPTFVALCVWVSPTGQSLTSSSYDFLYLFHPQPAANKLDNVVILNMDEESRSALGQDSNPYGDWDRKVHAQLLQRLTAGRAKAVVFDVLFQDPSPDPKTDAQLAEAIQAHGNVVLAAVLKTSRDEGRPASSHAGY